MKRLTLVLLGLSLAGFGLGCVSETGDGIADDTSEAVSAKLPSGLYVARPGTQRPRHDFLPAMSIGIDTTSPRGKTPANAVRYVFDYPGSPDRITGACLGTWTMTKTKLTLECSDPTIYEFSIVKHDASMLVLQNDDGEQFTLDRLDPTKRYDMRAKCEAEELSLSIDVQKSGDDRRVILQVTPKQGVLRDQSPRGVFVLQGAARRNGQLNLEGIDFYDESVKVSMPADPSGDFEASLTFQDDVPYRMDPKTHALACHAE